MPRYCDSDAAGHINNTAVAQWFEVGRFDLYNNYIADIKPLMLRKIEIEYLREMNYVDEVTLYTGVHALSNKTITLRQELWQSGSLRSTSLSTSCYVDSTTRRAAAIPDELRPLCADFFYQD